MLSARFYLCCPAPYVCLFHSQYPLRFCICNGIPFAGLFFVHWHTVAALVLVSASVVAAVVVVFAVFSVPAGALVVALSAVAAVFDVAVAVFDVAVAVARNNVCKF